MTIVWSWIFAYLTMTSSPTVILSSLLLKYDHFLIQCLHQSDIHYAESFVNVEQYPGEQTWEDFKWKKHGLLLTCSSTTARTAALGTIGRPIMVVSFDPSNRTLFSISCRQNGSISNRLQKLDRIDWWRREGPHTQNLTWPVWTIEKWNKHLAQIAKALKETECVVWISWYISEAC